MDNELTKLFDSLQRRLNMGLSTCRRAIDHPTAKGESSEIIWLKILQKHLPHRYQADSAFVVDSKGSISDQIDIVIYDRQYTPILYNQDNQRVLPAESVYAVFEVKQKLNKRNLEYAGQKAASVRRLKRTSVTITSAQGLTPPRPVIPIFAGILALQSEWKLAFGEPFNEALSAREALERLDLGCIAAAGSFDVLYPDNGSISLSVCDQEHSLIFFLMRLLNKLQCVGTVCAIDYDEYSDWMKKNKKHAEFKSECGT